MAKPVPSKPSTPAPPKVDKATTIYSYRVERLSTFEFQSYRITRKPDGSYFEEIWNKPSLLDLVARRIFEAMRIEANAVYETNKKAAEKAALAARNEAATR